MRRIWLKGGVLLGGCLAVLASGCAGGPESGRLRTIAVTGRGVIKVAPDMFLLDAGVSDRDPDIDKARARVTEISDRVIEIAKRYPIDPNRTRTTRFDVSAVYDREGRKLDSYQVKQGIMIYLREIAKGPDLTTEVLRAGATSVSIDFLAEEGKEVLVERAREAAVRDARDSAEKMAAVLGDRVGRALQIGKGGDEWDSANSQLFSSNQGSDGTSDSHNINWITPTEVEVEATVFVRFALVRAGER